MDVGTLSAGNSLCPGKRRFNYTWIMVKWSLWENITMSTFNVMAFKSCHTYLQ